MKKLMVLGVPIMLGALLLTGCEGDGEEKKPSEKAADGQKHELVYAEVLNDGSGDEGYPREEIKYMDHGKAKVKSTSTDNIYEHILKDDNQKPYMIEDDGDYHIYRNPYMIYGDDSIDGHVKDKKEIESNK